MANNNEEKLWVDDNRPAPEGWTWIKTFQEARKRIAQPFAAISLDWNIGWSPEWRAYKTGEDLMGMICRDVDFQFTVAVHTSSPIHRERMEKMAMDFDLLLVQPPINVPLGKD